MGGGGGGGWRRMKGEGGGMSINLWRLFFMDLFLFVHGDVEKTFMNTDWHCEVGKGLCVFFCIKSCWYYLLIHPPPLRFRQSRSLLAGPLTAHSSWEAHTGQTNNSGFYKIMTGDTFCCFCRHAHSCWSWWPSIEKFLTKMAWWHNIDLNSIIHP